MAGDLPQVSLHDTEATTVLNQAIADPFWNDAWKKQYNGQLYDEIRLASLESGYVPMVTGEGDVDFQRDVVADIVFEDMDQLPRYMSGAKAVISLGQGYDKHVGAEYTDTWYYLDLGLFYAPFRQRTYRVEDDDNDRTYLFFEQLKEGMVDSATWEGYSKKIERKKADLDLRWAFSGENAPSEVYGVYIVEPGSTRKTRVTMVSKLAFGSDSGFVARWGSQMPGVIKSGIKSGFDACVAIAKEEQKSRGDG